MRTVLSLAVCLLACDTVSPQGDSEPAMSSSTHAVTVEAEQAVDLSVVGGVGDVSDQPAVAWSGSQYLAVWRQDLPDDEYGTKVRAARIAADGTILDPAGLEIYPQEFTEDPAVAFFDGVFVVAYRLGGAVRLARVRPDGVVRAAGRIGDGGGRPDIAAGAGEAMIAYRGASIEAVRYDGDTAAAPVSLGAAAPDAQVHIAVSPSGDYLAVWNNGSGDIRARFVSAAGVPGQTVLISGDPDSEASPDVAFAGSGFVVVWQASGTGGERIRAAQVSASGTVGSAIDVSAVAAAAAQPSITCDADCVVTWKGGPDAAATDLRARRLGADLTPATDEWILVGGPRNQGPGAMAGSGGANFLVWYGEESGMAEVRGATASDEPGGQLALGPATLIATRVPNSESDAAVATGGSSWLVAWSDNRNGGADVFGKRFGFDGVAKTAAARTIHAGPDLQQPVKTAWNGSRYLVAWQVGGTPFGVGYGIRAARVEPGGAVVDPAGIDLGNGNRATIGDVAASPSGWLVVWVRSVLGGSRRVLFTRVALDGTTSAPVTLANGIGQRPAVEYDPGADVYVVIWLDSASDMFLASRIRPDGTILDSAPVPIAELPAGSWFFGLDTAYGGGKVAAAWRVGDQTSGDIEGVLLRVTGSGIDVLTPGAVPLVTSPEDEGQPLAVTFTARGYLLAFERFDGSQTDIYGVQLALTGLQAGTPFLLAGGPGDEETPAIAGASGGRALLSYQRRSGSDPPRVYVRRIVVGFPDGAVCTTDAQCESGICTDGHCAED